MVICFERSSVSLPSGVSRVMVEPAGWSWSVSGAVSALAQHFLISLSTVFIAIGLHLAGVIRIPWFFGRGLSVGAAGGMKGALLLGLFSGLALGPCSFAYVAPLLALTMKTAASNLPLALALVLLYALGHCSVILAAGTFTSVVSRYLRWGESDHLNVVNRILGGVIILIGLYFIYSAPR